MSRLRWLFVVLIIALIPGVGSHAQDDTDVSPFPLEKGSVWVYQGPVAWTLTGGTEVKEDVITWQMEVIDVIDRGSVVGYVMRGHPSDLAWYEEGKEPSNYGIIEVKPNLYYKVELETLERLRDDGDMLVDLVQPGQLFLDLPLLSSKRFCSTEQITRIDYMYCWFVSSVAPADLSGISGAPALESPLVYELTFRTNPDHVIWNFVPGIGITHFTYSHHGTISNVDVQLIEYHSQ